MPGLTDEVVTSLSAGTSDGVVQEFLDGIAQTRN
jgi:hypothetical protein